MTMARGEFLMRITTRIVLVASGAAMLSACGSSGILSRERPDEFVVQRQAPLMVPPDFDLVPPAPGAPRPTEGTAAQEAMEALFGGPAPRSGVETSAVQNAGQPEAGIRSSVGDPATHTVDKGATTRTILIAPEGDGQDASAVIPS